jgi:hypothetical protein
MLGAPNYIQKYYDGVAGKDFVAYVYFIYKDRCPKWVVEATAFWFVFDEGETHLTKIDVHDYGG